MVKMVVPSPDTNTTRLPLGENEGSEPPPEQTLPSGVPGATGLLSLPSGRLRQMPGQPSLSAGFERQTIQSPAGDQSGSVPSPMRTQFEPTAWATYSDVASALPLSSYCTPVNASCEE